MEQVARVHGIDTAFPLTYFIFGLGFLLILILECFVHTLKNKYHQKHSRSGDHPPLMTTDEPVSTTHFIHSLIAPPCSTHSYESIPMHTENSATMDPSVPCSVPVRSSRAITHAQHAHLDEFSTLESVDFLVAIVIFVGLSFHSIMEGLAIGASSKPVWDILIAIVAHKGLAAFALGQELLHHRVVAPVRFRFCIVLFSLMTPLGIAIGATILDQGKGETLLSGVCSALAAGTFLYVTMMEILPQELQDPVDRNLKCICFALGYCAFSSLAIWT